MDTRKLKDKASQAFSKGNFEKAAELYEELVAAEPKDLQLKVRLGDTLVRVKRVADAVKVYREVVDRYARDGLLLKSIAVCKIILEVDPGHGDTQALLADLYARKYGRAPEAPKPAAGPAPAAKPAPIPLGTPVAAGKPPGAARPAPAPIPLTQPIPLAQPIPLSSPVNEAEIPIEEDLSGGDELPPELQGAGNQSIEQIMREAEASVVARTSRPPPPPPDEAALSLEDRLDEVAPIGLGDAPLRFDEGARSPSSIEIAPGALRGLEIPGDDEEIEVLSVSAEAAPTPAEALASRDLPQIPLFSELGKAAFVELLELCNLKRLDDGDAAILADTVGDSFFVVVSGKVKVIQHNELGDELVLANLGEGAFFGEMALLSGAPRIASVIATEPTELLEFTAKALQQLVRDHPSVQNVLRKFYRQRLLTNVMATSPVFRPFDKSDRKMLVEKFKARDVERGEVVIEEGSAVDGLYVVLTGAIVVTKKDGAKKVTLATLREGDVFGEMSLLTKQKATATCTAKRRGTVLRLPRKSFDELILTHPQILELVSELTEERQQRTEAILEGKLACDEEGLVLV